MAFRAPRHQPPGQQQAQEARRRQEAARQQEKNTFYLSPAWKALIAAHAAENPLCRHCLEEGIITPLAEVDHIEPVKTAPDRRLDPSNLQGLCKPHHSKTAKETGFGGASAR
jgi:5-methylcytosine-specific restriction protein A